MKFRWTKEELEHCSNKRMLQSLINERLYDLNPYSPLATKLKFVNKSLDTDYSEIITALLEMKEVLPLFIGINPEFDKLIAERMKK